MPELPEVETTVRGLNKEVIGVEIEDVWTDWPKYFQKGPKGANHLEKTEEEFVDCVAGEEIVGVRRIGKNVILELSNEKALLVHQKLSGHLLVGNWIQPGEGWSSPKDVSEKWEDEEWVPDVETDDPLWDEKNRFIRLLFFLDDGRMMALSDLRRFAKVLCGSREDVLSASDIGGLGPDPLDPDFGLEDFREALERRTGRVKTLLMNQEFVAGIGNIYSDEVLWRAGIHPLTKANNIEEGKISDLFDAIKDVLKKGVRLEGTSIDDYRRPDGVKGRFEKELDVYQKEGEDCPRCGVFIERIKVGARSAHFCPKCQKENN